MPRLVRATRIPFERAGPLSETYTVDLDGKQYLGIQPGAFALYFSDGTSTVAYITSVTLNVKAEKPDGQH